jgi:Ion channel
MINRSMTHNFKVTSVADDNNPEDPQVSKVIKHSTTIKLLEDPKFHKTKLIQLAIKNNAIMMRTVTQATNKDEMPGSILKLSDKYFKTWRYYKLLGAVFGSLALIPAIFDYEMSYSKERTNDICTIQTDYTDLLRTLVLIFSFIGIMFQYPYQMYYFKWLNHYPLTFQELPAGSSISYVEVMNLLRKRKFKHYLYNSLDTVILFLLFPYPGVHIKFDVPQKKLYKDITVCYYFEEILYFIMYFRLFNLVIACFGYGMIQSSVSRRICIDHRVQISSSFLLKSYTYIYPIRVLFLFFLIPGIILFGIGLRIFERSFGNFNNQDFSYIWNSMWCIAETITTIGFGDSVPGTIFGRTIICMAIFWGGIILSITFVTTGKIIRLNLRETYAYRAILSVNNSRKIINKFITPKQSSNYIDRFKKGILKLLESNVKTEEESTKYKLSCEVYKKINLINDKASDTKQKLERLLKSLS